MMSKSKICVIVPAYNEAENIENVIVSLKTEDPNLHVVIINDASSDDTEKIASATGLAEVISLPCNLGIGGGVQTGFKYAVRMDADIAIQFDGDGQHLASEIPKIVAPIVEGKCDVAIGSRFLDELPDNFRSTAIRRIGIRFFQFLNSLIIGQKITDNTSGFRAYNARALRFLAADYPDDYPEPEAVIAMGKAGFRMMEIPVRMKERTGGASSITSLKSVYYMVKVTLAICITAIRPIPKDC